ncbi:MAG: hypothetical protein ACR2OR_01845 [Hyphomicrobiales bacterium]
MSNLAHYFDTDIECDGLAPGNHPHTHRAIDDAHGYAALLSKLLIIANQRSDHPEDFNGPR